MNKVMAHVSKNYCIVKQERYFDDFELGNPVVQIFFLTKLIDFGSTPVVRKKMIRMIHLLLLRLYRSVRLRFAQDQVWGGGIELFRWETQKKNGFTSTVVCFTTRAQLAW